MKSSARKTNSGLSRSILEFFPPTSSHHPPTPPSATTTPTPTKPQTSWQSLATPSLRNPLPSEPTNPDFRLSTFEEIVRTGVEIAVGTFNSEEQLWIGKFWRLSKQAKVLFARLMPRKGFWYNLGSVEYGVDVEEAAKELISEGFCIAIQDALSVDPECTYELLKSLRKPQLQSLLHTSKALLIQLTGEDHPDCCFPPFPKPEKNALYEVYRLLSCGEKKDRLKTLQIELEEAMQGATIKPKVVITGLVVEYLLGIKAKMGDLEAEWKVSKRKRMFCEGGSGGEWEKAIFMDDFPALIAINTAIFRLFTRIIATFTFFHPKTSLNSLNLQHISEEYTPPYHPPPSPPPLYTDSTSIQLIFEAFLLEKALNSLRNYHYSKDIEGKIACEIAEIALSVLTSDNTRFIPSLDAFFHQYSPISATLPWQSEYAHPWRWARVAHHCLPYLEKASFWSTAQTLLANLLSQPFLSHRRGYWWERLILNTHRHLLDVDGAKKVAEMALRDPMVRGGKRVTVEKQARRLGVQAGSIVSVSDAYFTQFIHPNFTVVTIQAPHIQGEAGPLYLGEDSIPMKVEEFAISWYSKSGWKGFHCENSLFRALFGILLWPVLYTTTVEGVFVHKFQDAALDYKSGGFFEARKKEFEEELGRLGGEGDVKRAFLSRVEEVQGCPSVYVDWEQVASWGLSNLAEILEAIPRAILLKLFLILAQDYKFTNHGLPDLLLWTPNEVLLVEVKSHNDKLADHQKLWILRLAEMGVRVELLHVLNGEYSGS